MTHMLSAVSLDVFVAFSLVPFSSLPPCCSFASFPHFRAKTRLVDGAYVNHWNTDDSATFFITLAILNCATRTLLRCDGQITREKRVLIEQSFGLRSSWWLPRRLASSAMDECRGERSRKLRGQLHGDAILVTPRCTFVHFSHFE